MTNLERPSPIAAFVNLWAKAISNVLGQIASAPFPIDAVDVIPDTATPDANDLHITITAGGDVRGEMSLRISQATTLGLVRIFTSEPGTDARELTADDRSAVEELLRQIAGQVSTSAKQRWREMPLTVGLDQAPTWSPAAHGWITASAAAPRQLGAEWKLSAALHAALLAAWRESTPADAGPSEIISNPGNLGFFMDVELDVTLRFGGKNILLKEILDLGPGSVLELDREIQDPADLLLDGKLIARGEVVMVNGNYGLRVIQIFTDTQPVA